MFEREKFYFARASIILLGIFMFFYILHIGASLLIPFLLAVLLAFAILGLSAFFQKLKLPVWLATIFSILTYILVFWGIGNIISNNIGVVVEILPQYQGQMNAVIKETFSLFNMEPSKGFQNIVSEINVQAVLSYIVGGLQNLLSSAGIILFYTVFILLEARNIKHKVEKISTNLGNRDNVFEIIDKIKTDVKAYFFVKTFVSLLLAVGSYMVLVSFGLELALFWTLLIFILNFIPVIGSVFAVLFPVIFSVIQFGDIYTTGIMLILLIFFQSLIGNVVEPKLMGNRLNLSPLVIIVSLAFWGALWGVIGMLLSVPLMVILNIILAKIPATRSVAVMLSEKGDLYVSEGFFGEKDQEKKKKWYSVFSKK